MTTSKARALVLAFDAADPTLVRTLAATGAMPTVARLLRDAAQVDTLAPEGVFVSANWPTIFTALRPDRHRYLCWEAYRGGTYEHRLTTPLEIQGTPFWQTLSDAGRRVALFDVPHTNVTPLNGAMVSEWGCHDRHFGTASWPPELAAELQERHGIHSGSAPDPGFPQFAPCDYTHRAEGRRTPAETETLFHLIRDDVDRKRAASLELLDRGGWDLFVTVFGESHCVGHQLWHLHDPDHPFHDAALAARLEGDPVTAIYRRLDGVVADHLTRLGPDDTAYVLFPHGMTAHHDGTHMLEQILHRLDWGLDHPDGLGGLTRAAGELASWIPRPLRGAALRRAAPLVRRRAGDGGSPEPMPAHAFRRWFLTPNNTVVGAVRLNLAGREPHGRILPRDRPEVLRWLSDRLTELVNVDTGGPVVRRCVISDDVYQRSDDDALGDLFVEWDRSAPIERVWSPATGTIAAPYDHWRQGDHVREGLLLAIGPGIAPGRRAGVVGTEDLGATFSAAVGVPLIGVDGRPIASVLPIEMRPASPTRRSAAAASARAKAGAALRRRAARRLPAWREGQDPALARLRTELAGVDPALNDLRARVDGAHARGEQAHAHADARADAVLARLRTELAGVDPALNDLRASVDGAHARGERAHAHVDARADAVLAHLDGLHMRTGQLERDAALWTARAWVQQMDVPEDELISVVMPTRDRRELLETAIASVAAQSYSRWELVVVDDGSADDTPALLASIQDPRIRVLRTEGVGACAARNLALDAATGGIVTYLDDDNRFDPDWLKAVALTFATHPEHDTAFGARLVDDYGRLTSGIDDGRGPWIHFVEWDAVALREYNSVDQSAIAHRRGSARFDPELAYFGDWDLLLKLTADRAPIAVPMVAVYYRTDTPERLSTSIPEAEIEREYQRVRQRLAER